MFSPAYLCICVFCMLQLSFLIHAINRHNVQDEQEKYFRWMLIITLFSFLADMASSLHKVPDWLFPFNAAGNYIEIILNTLLIPIFYRYICDQIINLDVTLRKNLNLVLWIMSVASALIVISTTFTGQIFYFDDNNIYHRGPLFSLLMFFIFLMMVIIEVFLISQKQKIEAHYYLSLLLFLIFPCAGFVLQCFIYGLPFTLLGISFAALVLYTNIQNRNMDKDYLTGAFNRQALDNYMQHKIDTATKQKTFSAILIDLDDFKTINDRYGHFEGDDALINSVRILRNSIKNADFIARYGGDEFCVILSSDNSAVVEDTILQINNSLTYYNENENKSYQLSFSMGYGIYDLAMGKGAELFLRIIDKKMYEQKVYTKRLQQDSQFLK